jgi:hypothetical protein
MKSGSVEAFHVVVVCQKAASVQDPAQRLAADGGDDALAQQVVAQLGQRPGGERGDASVAVDMRASRCQVYGPT